MTADTTTRIPAVEQYLQKWQPVLTEWFGEKGADAYCRRYYAYVIIGLGNSAIKRGAYKNGIDCYCRVIRRNPTAIDNYIYVFKNIVMTLCSQTLSIIRKNKSNKISW